MGIESNSPTVKIRGVVSDQRELIASILALIIFCAVEILIVELADGLPTRVDGGHFLESPTMMEVMEDMLGRLTLWDIPR